jgi:hypothetical protein
MCLIPEVNKIEIAKEDIKVFKLLERNGRSPFQGTFYHLGETKRAKAFSDVNGRTFTKDLAPDTGIYKGIHAFQNLPKALNEMRFNGEIGFPSFIVEAIIPKGTKYIKGVDNDIVSLKLVIGKAINNTRNAVKFRKVFNGQTS